MSDHLALPSDLNPCAWDANYSRSSNDPTANSSIPRVAWRHNRASNSGNNRKTADASDSSATTAIANISLADLTTTAVGGHIANYREASCEAELIEAITTADQADQPLLVIGGGSNILAGDAPFDGTVVRDGRAEITVREESACGGVTVDVTAGTPWDELVATAIENGWMGIESLSGIPGTVGAAPVQNIGAYGQEVSETISMVTVYDRIKKRRLMLALGELKFGYRTSLLKQSMIGATPRYVVLSVQFQFRHATLSAPIRYAELARQLDVNLGDRVDSRQLREQVLKLRRAKGMVLDPIDRDTFSTGSFFTNPIVDTALAEALPDCAPRFPVLDHTKITNIDSQPPTVPNKIKLSAAWLIDHAGFSKGFQLTQAASLSTKHVLAITNRGEATAKDIEELALTVREGVYERFGIRLEPEPVCINIMGR